MLAWSILLGGLIMGLTWKFRRDPIVQSLKLKNHFRCRLLFPLLCGIMFFFPYPYILLSANRVPQQDLLGVELIGSGLTIAFLTIFFTFATCWILYVLSPGISKRLSSVPSLEVFSILKRFPDYPYLGLSSSSFLIEEAHSKVTELMEKGFPNLTISGVDDILVDIQIAIRNDKDDERKAILEFLNNMENLRSRPEKQRGVSSFLLSEINTLKEKLSRTDKIRADNRIIGNYDGNIARAKFLALFGGIVLITVIAYSIVVGFIQSNSILPEIVITIITISIGLIGWSLRITKLRER